MGVVLRVEGEGVENGLSWWQEEEAEEKAKRTMSILSRLRNLRQETTERVWGSTTTTKASPPTFVPDMITEEVWDRDDVNHQCKVARQDPLGRYIVYNIAENVFDDWFEFYATSDREHKTPIMQDIQAEFRRMRAKHYFTQALAGERMNGHCWLYFSPTTDYRVDDSGNEIQPTLGYLDFFTAQDAEVTEFDEDGEPKTLTVTVKLNDDTEQKTEIPVSDCILFRTRPYDRSYKGQPVTAPVWDDLVYLRYVKHGMAWYAMKIGIGLLYAKTKGKLTTEMVAAVESMLIDAGPRRAMVYADRDIAEVGFLQATAGATDFSDYANTILGQIAAGTGIPKDILIGASAGALAGSEINSKALYATLAKEQAKVDPNIREVVRRMGHTGEDYDIVWNTRYATNELEQAQIGYLKAQTAQLLQLAENMKKGENPNDINVRVKQGSEREQQQTRNPEGRQ